MKKNKFDPFAGVRGESKKPEPKAIEVKQTQQFSFPEFGITIEATSQSEAIEKLKKLGKEVK